MLRLLLSYAGNWRIDYCRKTLQRPMIKNIMTMIKLTTRVLEKIFGLFCMFFGGAGGGTICFVPQMGHMRTPSRSSVPQVGQITVSSPNSIYHYYYRGIGGGCQEAGRRNVFSPKLIYISRVFCYNKKKHVLQKDF